MEVALLKDHVMLTLDTTGPSLFKRGYRLEKGGAPLKEKHGGRACDAGQIGGKIVHFMILYVVQVRFVLKQP